MIRIPVIRSNFMDAHPNNALHLKVQFLTYFLGTVKDISEPASKRITEATLIDIVEESQLAGHLQLTSHDQDAVIFYISRHGIKVLDRAGLVVSMRHPLHTIAHTVYYDDGFGRSNIIVKIGQVGKSVFQAYVFQALSAEQAREICASMKRIFDVVSESAA